jgi:hypothetical protein
LFVLVARRAGVNGLLGYHDKKREVQSVNAFTQYAALPSALSTLGEEALRILEMIARDIAPEGLIRLQRLAVAGIDVSHLAFADDDKRSLMNFVLPWVEAEVQAAAQQSCLKARFALSRDNASFPQGAVPRPDLFDDTDHGVRDVNDAQQAGQEVDSYKSCDHGTDSQCDRGAELDFT